MTKDGRAVLPLSESLGTCDKSLKAKNSNILVSRLQTMTMTILSILRLLKL